MKENYTYLLNEVKKLAFESFKIFINRLELDVSLFEHLYNIKCSIGETTTEDAYAEYYQDLNKIIISEKKVISSLKKLRNKVITYEELVERIAISYLHEMLHANRTIIIGSLLNIRNYNEFSYKQKYNKKHKEELELYRYALENILSNYDINDFVGSIPISVKFNKDKTYSVVAYNDKNKSFEFYENQKFNVNLKNVERFLITLSKELVNEKGKHPISRVVYDYYDYDDVVALPCDYYRFDSNIDLTNKKLNIFKMLEKKIKSQVSFEEIITEALAVLMIYTRNDQIVIDDILKNSIDENVCVGIDVINSFDVDTLRWYFLSTYDDVYYDRFNKIFKDKYISLLKIMYKLYEMELPLTEEIDNELNCILKGK